MTLFLNHFLVLQTAGHHNPWFHFHKVLLHILPLHILPQHILPLHILPLHESLSLPG